MISSSGRQSDKEVETSFVHFMQMYTLYVCHKGTAEAKYHYLAPLAHPRTALGPKHLQVFFPSSVQLFCGGATKMLY